MLVRRWLDEAGIHDPLLRQCYTVCVRNIADVDKGTGRWWAVKGMPAAVRPHLAALAATAFTADRCADTGPVEERRDRLDEYAEATFAAIETGRSADPVLHAAAHTHRVTDVPALSVCRDMFDAARRDLDFRDFETYEDLRWWMTRASGGPMIVTMWLLLGPEITRAFEPVCRELGELFQFADNICDLAEDLAEGRLYLPLEDLDRFGVSVTDLKAGRWTPGMEGLIAFETERVTGRLARLVPFLDRHTPLPATMLRWIGGLMLEVRAAGPAVLARPVRLRFPDFAHVWQPQWRAMIPC